MVKGDLRRQPEGQPVHIRTSQRLQERLLQENETDKTYSSEDLKLRFRTDKEFEVELGISTQKTK